MQISAEGANQTFQPVRLRQQRPVGAQKVDRVLLQLDGRIELAHLFQLVFGTMLDRVGDRGGRRHDDDQDYVECSQHISLSPPTVQGSPVPAD
ncbi:hypothetical protein D3C86_1784180 [compost metagenome]